MNVRVTRRTAHRASLMFFVVFAGARAFAGDPDSHSSPTYLRFKHQLDAVPAIDTHDHLFPFDRLPSINETKQGRGVNLAGLWQNSYYRRFNPLTPWKAGMDFDDWWKSAKHDFKDAHTTSFYRYQLPAFRDLYGVDFDQITDAQARELDRQIFEHYQDQRWLYHVVTERANIELMFNDPYWARYAFTTSYPWEVLVFNVTPLVRGYHASEFTQPLDSPYEFAKKHGLPVDSLDDYLKVLDRLYLEAKDRGAVCLKTTLAYERTLLFDNIPRERAEAAFGKRRAVPARHRSRSSRISSCGGSASSAPSTSFPSKSTREMPASRDRIRCSWSI